MKNYLIYLLAAVSCTTVADLKAQVSTKTGNETTELPFRKSSTRTALISATLRKDLTTSTLFPTRRTKADGFSTKKPPTSSKERN